MTTPGTIRTGACLRSAVLLAAVFVVLPCRSWSEGTSPFRIAHVVVALADNRYQGIVPVPALIGNGDDPARNLYWGAGYGVRTFLQRTAGWDSIGRCVSSKHPVLERCVFRHRQSGMYVVADAYRGREIKRAISDFFAYSAGRRAERVPIGNGEFLAAGGASDLIAYVGHDGLMDFALEHYEYAADNKRRCAVMLACATRSYFADALRWTGARPLLWTTGLMAPEAYVLEPALSGWAAGESDDQIRRRAAEAYHSYQRCGAKAALRLFTTGW